MVIAEKDVAGGTLRLSTIAADVPAEGRTGVDMDAAATLATEQIVKVAKDQIADLSPNAIATIVAQVREVISQLTELNLVAGASDSPLPPEFGAGLQKPQQIAQAIEQVEEKVEQQQNNLPAPTGDVAIAKGIVQMLRDFGISLADIPDSEFWTIDTAVKEQETVVSEQIQITEALSERLYFLSTALGELENHQPGRYRTNLDQFGSLVLDRIGDTDNKTWIVEFTLGHSAGMELKIIAQNPVPVYDVDFPTFTASNKFTYQVRKQGDPSLQYDGTLEGIVDAQGNITQYRVTGTIRDRDLRSPITFNGTFSGTPESGSTPENLAYTQVSFSGNFNSQFGSARVDELKAIGLINFGEEPISIKQISLTNLQVSTQTSKPSSLTLSGTVEMEEAPQSWLDKGWEGDKPKSGTITATLQGSGITLQISNAQISDFVLTEEVEALPRRLNGQASYTSPTLTFNGTANAFWEGLGSTGAEQGKGTLTLQGNWKPKVGSPANVSINVTSTSQDIQISLTLNYGTQKLEGTFTGTWRFVDDQIYGLTNSTTNLTHSPSNFKVSVSAQAGQAVSGTITTAQGQKVADIGEARNLGLPDLGSAIIIKYTDGTFETLESILPRSRVSRR